MGYLLKEALKTLCGVNQWSYAIFWKIGCQNPKLLIWEECYCEPVIYSNAAPGVQARNKVDLLVTRMMKDNYISLLGEGLVGRVAFTGNHQWIISDNKMLGAHPPEVSNEVYTQFSAGIQTIAVIPVNPHGVVQLGSSSRILENLGFVNDVKSLIAQLGCVPGALLSENYMKNEGALTAVPNHRELICLGNSVSAHSSGKSKVTECTFFTSDGCNQQGHSPQASGSSGHSPFSFSRPIVGKQVASGSTLANPVVCQSSMKPDEDQCRANVIPLIKQNFSFRTDQRIGVMGVGVTPQANLYGRDPEKDQQTAFGSFSGNYDLLRSMASDAFLGDHGNDTMTSGGSNHMLHLSDEQPKPASEKQKLEHELVQALTMPLEEACLKPPSRDDLFDIVGMDFRSKLLGGNRGNSSVLELQGAASDLFPVYKGESDDGIYSLTASDHLLDAVVSKVHSSSKQVADDNVSCRTSLTENTSSSTPVAYTSSVWAHRGIDLVQRELVGVPKSLKKTGVTSSYSYKSGISKEDGGNISDTSSIISSQISSWTGQRHDMRRTSGVAPEHTKKADEISKSSRKRLKPGENPRPRPKDRQMIQDRVKELREIVPNGAKCSIDALLERTIKHMLFLQSVTKHADKLKQTGESKIVGKDGGLLLRDNFEGGATWAYEVGSQSMVCPIIVEDLNSPRQMLVEMLCEERGSFLEIADVIKGLGLTILKGVMESRNDKIWAHFTVEANRDVTRMEIFISLVSLFDQTVKSGAATAAAERNGNANISTIPTTVRPRSIR